ncbi:hypothetical protein [Acinetobacter baumannii]|uniref:hypothetical protein n=1 Tax=Acinetobacter baumannii TaxID=470 RepID=UPI00046799EC|nr:hypothetical protein [Acinetobacter baumannii]EKT8144446.1 hypothetical protein [Acinetobacter baumannii]EKU7086491.1 hypothetical protein [Acinetobacter baumannii]EKV1043132.1 hypothetical protein [Acinetobacter baumannii]EKV1046586.1 hypothetical protein [Acinetobacter baumannii]EKV1920366.1 hypothetical protein [Acinetobacter baumannii]
MNQAGLELIDCDDVTITSNTVIGWNTSIRFTNCSNINASKNTLQYGKTGIGLIDCSGRVNIKRNFGHQIDEMIRVEQTENNTKIVPNQKISNRDKKTEKNKAVKAVVDKHFLELEHSKVKLKEIIEHERKFNSEIRELLNLEAQEKFLKNYAEVKRIQYKKANWGAPILALK